MYECFLETKFIQGCRPVSFHCLLSILALLFCSKTRSGSTEDKQQSQHVFERLLEMWLTFCRQDSSLFSEHWCAFVPGPSCSHTQGQVPRSPELKMSTAMKWQWLISGKKHYSKAVSEHGESDRLMKTISSSLNGRCELETCSVLLLFLAGVGAVTELLTAASREEFNGGWCQDLAEERHVSFKTMILTQEAVFKFQHSNCQRGC